MCRLRVLKVKFFFLRYEIIRIGGVFFFLPILS